MKSTSLSLAGTVFDPPLPYQASDCVVQLSQSGNTVTGLVCEREAGFSF
jgi:hypothetical protein